MSNPFQRGILVGVDGSPSSIAAVKWAAHTAALHHVALTAVHVLAPPVVMTFPEAPMPAGYAEWQQQQGERFLREALDAASGEIAPEKIEAQTLTGPTMPALTELSCEADMMVVGSRGQGWLRRSLLGSVSSGLVRHAHCPVTVIHGDRTDLPHPEEAPVVVGVDGSAISEAATEAAFAEAALREVNLIAVYAWHDAGVMDFPGIDAATMQTDGEMVLAERLAGFSERYPDVQVQRVVACDRPADQLIEQSHSAQLVVVGSHGRGGFTGMLLGSVSLAVVQSSRAPVLVVRGVKR